MSVPANLDAEQAVLGAILLADGCIPQVLAQGLQPEDFYWATNERVFAAMVSMYEDRRHVDPLTLGEFLGDRVMVDRMAAAPFSASHVGEYARIVIDLAYRRRMRTIAFEMLSAADKGDMGELRSLVGRAQSLLPKEGLRAVDGRAA